MSRIKVLRNLFLSLMVAVCLAPDARALETADARELARQIAAAVNDNAASLEERREALKKLEESARLFINAGETAEAARVLSRVGRLQLILNAPQDALASHRKALALLKQTLSLEAEVDNLNGLGAVYMLLQNKERAEKALRKSLMLSEQSGYVLGQAQALLTLSNKQNHDNHVLAVQTALAALKLWQKLDDKTGLARTYAQVGQYYLAQNILPEAAQNCAQALRLWQDLNNRSEQAETLILLGFIEFRKGDWQNSLSFYTQAQSLIDEKAEPDMMGQIESGLGEAFNENGLPETSLVHFQQAVKYYQQTQDPYAMAYAIRNLGYTYYLLRNYPEALAHLQQALALVDKDSIGAAPAHEFIGRVYLATAEYPAALQSLQPALSIYTRAANRMEAARVLGLIGQVYERQGHLERARQNYRQALKTFHDLSDRVNEAVVYYALGRLELRSGNYDAAEDYLRQSIEATENVRRISTSTDLTVAFSATVHERYENYIECLMRKGQTKQSQALAIRAFETSELSRARSLTELLRATQTNLISGLDPKLAEQEKSLRQSLRVKEDEKVKLLGKAYKKEELDALDAELLRLEAEYKQVTETIHARYPSYEQLTRPVAWDLRQIQEQVVADDQTVLLEYSLGADKSYVWAVTRNGIKSYELPAEALVNEAAKKVYNLLANRPGTDSADELTPAAQELSRMILSPVAAHLNKRRVIVVADGVLNYIPFQVLPAPSATTEPLVANYEVINAPSASILGELRQEAARRQPAAKVLAAFGDPVFASDYALSKDTDGSEDVAVLQTPESEHQRQALRDLELNGDTFDPSAIKRLFYAKSELANLRNAAAGGETFMATEFDATRERLQSTDLTQYAILHIATHGFLDPVRPEYLGLVLSNVNRDGQTQDGFVRLQDIYNLRTPVNLVVLSACRTALGKEVRGEGLISLTRGFMYAGASSVVASLWKVDDKATAELMRQFYINMLQKEMTPAAALREAQNSIRQEPQWRSPFYWAAFTLQGEYRRVLKPTPVIAATAVYRKMTVGGALLTLLAGVAWWYRRRRLRTAQASA